MNQELNIRDINMCTLMIG